LLALIDHQGVLHSKRIEDGLLQKLGVTLASAALDDLAEDDVGGIAVFEFVAWGEAEFLLAAKDLKHFRSSKFVGRGRTLRGPKVVLVNLTDQKLLVLGETRSVIEQVADGDGPCIVGKLRARLGK